LEQPQIQTWEARTHCEPEAQKKSSCPDRTTSKWARFPSDSGWKPRASGLLGPPPFCSCKAQGPADVFVKRRKPRLAFQCPVGMRTFLTNVAQVLTLVSLTSRGLYSLICSVQKLITHVMSSFWED
jgi:hypothetical protein